MYSSSVFFMFATAASAQTSTTFRDASGRTIGTVTTDSNGTKTFRDGSGRTTGTANTDANGTTTFRDGSGRMTSTATPPRERDRRMGR
jgi:YD repeat-containing protein